MCIRDSYSKTALTATNALVEGRKYIITTAETTDTTLLTGNGSAAATASATEFIATGSATLNEGRVQQVANQLTVAASEGRTDTDTLTAKIEAVQALVNTARVQAGSQYAAIESAVNYTTDLTAQYELGFNTVNDVNFSMETAHLAKNQILQQAATAMLAQANMGQQSLLQLIQG